MPRFEELINENKQTIVTDLVTAVLIDSSDLGGPFSALALSPAIHTAQRTLG
jgi:hypothetical protein